MVVDKVLLLKNNIQYIHNEIKINISFKRAFFQTRPSDLAQIWHACADRDETGSHQNNLPTPPQRGLGGYLLMFVACGMFVGGLWHDSSRW